ncbi:Myosin heavy chain-like protein [Hirschfeldia incana]|nr:Myosin heavy chain-like protein [Hirschfeldia incana]
MERECEEGGDIEKKLRRSFLIGSCSKRAGPSTPPPTWRLGGSSSKEFLVDSEVSVRKLCAELWETEHFRPPVGLPRCRRRRDSDVESPCDDHQPPSRGSLRRPIVSTDDVHRHGDLLQPVTPSSSSNHSLEVVKRKPAFSQTGSSMVKSASYGLGSSTKLLKVLNRIWSLEEQNTANTSLVKALKMELDECRAEIKEVQHREKQSHRRIHKKKEEEEEEMKDVLRSMKKELDEEREVRKKSESMHRKLTRELCEAKHCLAKALKDLEKERKERVVVEDLCDEFAKTVKDYEDKEMMRRRSSHSSKDDSVYMHQRVCLKELEEGLKRRSIRRDNKLQLKRSGQVCKLSMSSEGDKIHPEIGTPRKVGDDHESLEKYRSLSKNVMMVREESRSLKDKLMEARVESRRLRSLKSTPSHPVQAI